MGTGRVHAFQESTRKKLSVKGVSGKKRLIKY